ncbi:uncharacterized protein TNCV_4380961 [Trichonephila clavipes]|nr:uncharacterized protein TNCV_4380961 [Trichonephila clavipes]
MISNPRSGHPSTSRNEDKIAQVKAVVRTDRRLTVRENCTRVLHFPHVTTLEEDLKQQPLCQDCPKNVLSDSGLEIELAIPFVQNRDPPDTPQQSELGERSCIIIHQNEVVTNSSSIWADIWIKDLIPISKTSYGFSMEHMKVSVATERDPCPKTRIPTPL